VYSVDDYGSMMADPVRMGAFARALEATITPGSVVLDLGTGTGIMALLACRFGARRVYALEPDDVIEVAREIAALNGCSDRIEFIQDVSTRVTLPERADVIVSDIGGIMPWFQRHIPAMVDARRRLLSPGGILIPERDDVWAAVVEAPAVHARKTGPWESSATGFDMAPARQMALNRWIRARLDPAACLSRAVSLATIDYSRIESHDLDTSATLTIDRPGTGHGLLAGVTRTLARGITLTNLPGAPEHEQSSGVYDTVCFPWTRAVSLDEGDVVTCGIGAKLIEHDYVWTWRTRVVDRGDREKAAFLQSTFFGAPVSRETLRRRAAHHVPEINDEGRMARFILDAMGRGVSVREIAIRLHAEFPERLPGFSDALRRVTALSAFYD
jgi:protein arginine N-methyltransferase 1